MTTPLPPVHPDDVAWVREHSRPVTTAVGIRAADVPSQLVLDRLTQLRAELSPPPPTIADHRSPGRWDRWGPHTERRLAVVHPQARGWHLPVVIHQLVGGKRWSLALIEVGPFTKDPEATS